MAAVIASHEFSGLTRNLRPLTPVGLAGAAGVVLAVHEGGIAWATAPLALTLVAAFWLSAVAEVRQSAAVQLSVTTFGVVWIGLGFGFLVAIRDIPAPSGWGRELLLAVLLGRVGLRHRRLRRRAAARPPQAGRADLAQQDRGGPRRRA